LLSLESLEFAETQNDEGTQSIVRFRYHLGREVHGWLVGEGAQYTQISGKLLTYHPVRQKYQILLGFCLAYYDRVNRKYNQTERRLRLPALLSLASLEVPDKRIAEFFSTIEDALEDLSRDGVIPGLKLQKPANWTELLAKRNTRALIAQSVISYPSLPTGKPMLTDAV
jgi:hypothetical protein